MRQGKGAGYAKWARSFNLREASKTLIFLQEIGVKSYDELVERAAAASADFKSRNTKIKAAENRMDEIKELQKQIANYGRTKEIYSQYKAAGYSKKFRAEHEEEILLHQAAKNHFDSLGLKKIPKIAELKQEYATLLAERKKQYTGYQESKEMMRKLVMAKDNANRILGISDTAPKTKNHEAKHTSRNREI
jgi:type III secretory pathway component EscV